MATFPTGDEKYRDVIYDDDYRSYLMTQRDAPGDYRFGRTQGKRVRVHARTALRRVNGYFRTMIEAIANAKLRRMERELELRGIRFDRPNDNWVARKSQPTERS
jgi:GDP-D-mannose dehydratase